MDCMEGMGQFPDNYFDLAIVDPPYGKKPHSNFGSKQAIRFNKNDVAWDVVPDKKYFKELFRLSKNQIIWGGNYFWENLYSTNCIIIWDKQNGNNPFADFEFAWTSLTGNAKIYKYFWLGSHVHRKETVIHPTQKPVSLYKAILNDYGQAGWKILDTHVGSGSSLIACEREGFQYVGFEIDPDYYKAAKERIERERNILTLELH